jgi:type I restriction enzyme, S subunit
MTSVFERGVTETGGRKPTTRHIPPKLALAVGMPSTQPPKGWKWKPLSSVAKLESGHTPSRRHPEYWGGEIPWIGIADAKVHHGRRITETLENTNELGIANSSARILPENTVCLSRTASVGYVVIMGQPMATSQDFVNWICTRELDHNFLKYLLIAEGDDLLRFASGAVHSTIYFPEVKAFHICLPDLDEQKRIVGILNDAFDDVAVIRVNAERNLANARALFESYLQFIFTNHGEGWIQKRLGDLSRINYGYTESASRDNVGPKFLRITDIQDNGVDWSSVPHCRIDPMVLPKYELTDGDIVFARTGATTGKSYLVIDPPKAVFASYLIRMRLGGHEILPQFLYLFFQTPSYWDSIHAGVSGSAQGGFNASKLGELIIPFPRRKSEQLSIVTRLLGLAEETRRLASIHKEKLAALDELNGSLLHQAFSGCLTKPSSKTVVIPFPTKIPGITTTDLHAGILATAYNLHEQNAKQKHFGHVKAEKIAHMVEAHAGIDLGRAPIKDAAGPNDYPHQLGVEHRARKAGYFDFKRVGGARYQVKKLAQFTSLIKLTREKLGDRVQGVDELITLMLPMTTQQAEVFATVYAAWNNLLRDGQIPTDEEIVLEARENWHPAKMSIPREKFFKAIEWLREKRIVPSGRGRKVAAKVTQ